MTFATIKDYINIRVKNGSIDYTVPWGQTDNTSTIF